MSPNDTLSALRAETDFTEDEKKAFHSFSETMAYHLAVRAMTRMMMVCGDMALDDGDTRYWQGVKAGIGLFFEMTEGEAADYDSLIAETLYQDKEKDVEDEENETDLTQAISTLGTSPL